MLSFMLLACFATAPGLATTPNDEQKQDVAKSSYFTAKNIGIAAVLTGVAVVAASYFLNKPIFNIDVISSASPFTYKWDWKNFSITREQKTTSDLCLQFLGLEQKISKNYIDKKTGNILWMLLLGNGNNIREW
jgi:hypothetical protein